MSLSSLATAEFVLLTTHRRTGEGVATPVWAAPTGDGALVVTTLIGTGKVKRLRRDPTAEVVACSRTGQVAPGATTTSVTVEIVEDTARYGALSRPLATKYGLLYRLTTLADRIPHRRGRRVYLLLRST